MISFSFQFISNVKKKKTKEEEEEKEEEEGPLDRKTKTLKWLVAQSRFPKVNRQDVKDPDS